MNSLYHSLRASEGASAARNLTRTVLENNKGNVSKTAYILGCSRYCVRRAREGLLKDYGRTPRHQPRKTAVSLEEFVLKVRQEAGYGKRRLRKHLKAKFGLMMSENTIAKILKRGHVRRQTYQRSGKAPKPLYDYENLIPFEEGQIDTKHIEDFMRILYHHSFRYAVKPSRVAVLVFNSWISRKQSAAHCLKASAPFSISTFNLVPK